jgi:hypothetical protein
LHDILRLIEHIPQLVAVGIVPAGGDGLQELDQLELALEDPRLDQALGFLELLGRGRAAADDLRDPRLEPADTFLQIAVDLSEHVARELGVVVLFHRALGEDLAVRALEGAADPLGLVTARGAIISAPRADVGASVPDASARARRGLGAAAAEAGARAHFGFTLT